jgi:hypothetical protein
MPCYRWRERCRRCFPRAEPRDFLDIDAAVTTGRYTMARLCELAERADARFDRRRVRRPAPGRAVRPAVV